MYIIINFVDINIKFYFLIDTLPNDITEMKYYIKSNIQENL